MRVRGQQGKQEFLPISFVARRYRLHPQTLRLYEREGLINPVRTRGNTRLYDQDSLHRLDLIVMLTRELGVNLAGVEVILGLRAQVESMNEEVARLVAWVGEELRSRRARERRLDALACVPPATLARRDER